MATAVLVGFGLVLTVFGLTVVWGLFGTDTGYVRRTRRAARADGPLVQALPLARRVLPAVPFVGVAILLSGLLRLLPADADPMIAKLLPSLMAICLGGALLSAFLAPWLAPAWLREPVAPSTSGDITTVDDQPLPNALFVGLEAVLGVVAIAALAIAGALVVASAALMGMGFIATYQVRATRR